MEGQSESDSLSRIMELFKLHVSQGGYGKLSVSPSVKGIRRVELALDLHLGPAANHARNDIPRCHGYQQPPTRRNKPPSRRRRDRERKEAWKKKKDSLNMESVHAPDSAREETGSGKLTGEVTDTSTGPRQGALDGLSGGEGDCLSLNDGEDEALPSAPDLRPGENKTHEISPMDFQRLTGEKLPFWYNPGRFIIVNFSNVPGEKTGVKCTLHSESYEVMTLRDQKSYNCLKCWGITRFQRFGDKFIYIVHRNIIFTNRNVMSIVSKDMQ